MTNLIKGTRVSIAWNNLKQSPTRVTGVIIKVRDDGRGRAIYTLSLDDSTLTDEGLYYARAEELQVHAKWIQDAYKGGTPCA